MKHTTLKKTNIKDYKNNKVLEIRHIRSQKWNKHEFFSKLLKKIHVWKAENIIRKWIAIKRYRKSKTLLPYYEAKLNVTLLFVDSEYFIEWNKQEPRIKEIYIEIFIDNYEAFQVLLTQPFNEQLEIIHILLEWSDIERVIGIKELEIITEQII